MQANYKIQGAKLQYDIYALCLRLRDNTFRAEHEEKVSSFDDNYRFTLIMDLEKRKCRERSQ